MRCARNDRRPLLRPFPEEIRIDAFDAHHPFGGDAEVMFDHEFGKPIPIDQADGGMWEIMRELLGSLGHEGHSSACRMTRKLPLKQVDIYLLIKEKLIVKALFVKRTTETNKEVGDEG